MGLGHYGYGNPVDADAWGVCELRQSGGTEFLDAIHGGHGLGTFEMSGGVRCVSDR